MGDSNLPVVVFKGQVPDATDKLISMILTTRPKKDQQLKDIPRVNINGRHIYRIWYQDLEINNKSGVGRCMDH